MTKDVKQCGHCNLCCKHIVIELDTPENKEDYHEILWFLCHKNIKVYIGDEGDWNAEINNECKYLKDSRCSIYEERPDICRGYEPDECELHGEGEYYKKMFESRDDFLKYMEENNIKFD